jgi:hypothetical protein
MSLFDVLFFGYFLVIFTIASYQITSWVLFFIEPIFKDKIKKEEPKEQHSFIME